MKKPRNPDRHKKSKIKAANKGSSHRKKISEKKSFSNDKNRKFSGKAEKKQTSKNIAISLSSKYPEADIAISNYVLPHRFKSIVLAQCKALKQTSLEDKNRIDLRKLPFVTIDGDDAKDFDDAVYAQPIKKVSKDSQAKWQLFVAIADVSHYVETQTPLDEEAYLRGTSVYFPRLVLPMLPPVLSEDLCSLVPNKDRPVLVCEMQIDNDGNCLEYKFYPALINSFARLTYSQTEEILFSGNASEDKPDNKIKLKKEVNKSLLTLKETFWALRFQREKRGALDIDSKEFRFTFTGGKVSSIYQDWRGQSHKLIEECMVAANVCAAKFLENRQSTLFRNHQPPSPDNLEILKEQLAEFEIKARIPKLPKEEKEERKAITPLMFADILAQAKKHEQSQFLQYLVLRSLKTAVYAPDNLGHFGLGLSHYAHFTSPIRRYPDLLVHRAIKKLLIKIDKKSKKIKKKSSRIEKAGGRNWPLTGEHCSYCEKRSDGASRDANMMLRCELAKKDIGESLKSRVAGVTKFGIFVQLERSYADGLIPMKTLGRYFNDYVEFDEQKKHLVSPKTGKIISLGTEVIVVVNAVNSWDRRLDLELIKILV